MAETINITDLQTGDRILLEALPLIVLEVRAGGMGHLDIWAIPEQDEGPAGDMISGFHDPHEEFVLLERAGSLAIHMPDYSKWKVPLAYIVRYQKVHHPDISLSTPYDIRKYAMDHMEWEALAWTAVPVEKPDYTTLYQKAWPNDALAKV